jgi:hypothetical protein
MMNTFGQSFAKNRSEDDILAHAPLKLMLGKIEYSIEPLPINKNRKWREKVAEALNTMSTKTNAPMDNMNGFMGAFMAMFFSFPDIVLTLIMEYAPTLPKDIISETATDEEVVVAFSRVMAVAYPFFGLLGTMQAISKATSSATTHPQ